MTNFHQTARAHTKVNAVNRQHEALLASGYYRIHHDYSYQSDGGYHDESISAKNEIPINPLRAKVERKSRIKSEKPHVAPRAKHIDPELFGSYKSATRPIPASIRVSMTSVRQWKRDDQLGIAAPADKTCRCGHAGFAHSAKNGCNGNHGLMEDWANMTYSGHDDCDCDCFVVFNSEALDKREEFEIVAKGLFPHISSARMDIVVKAALAISEESRVSIQDALTEAEKENKPEAKKIETLVTVDRSETRTYTTLCGRVLCLSLAAFNDSIRGLEPSELSFQQRFDLPKWRKTPAKQAAYQAMLMRYDKLERERLDKAKFPDWW